MPRTLSVYQLVGRALGEVAPFVILTASSESAAFLLGAISTMPAVRTFSLYAGVAVFFNFILQVHNNLIYTHTHRVLSVLLYSQRFLLLMYLDALCTKNNYLEILCCIQIPKNSIPFRVRLNLLNWIIRKFISRFVLHKFVRPVVVS